VFGATDTPETRRHEAERYLQATPAKALFEDMADKMAANLPAEQREQFKRMMTAELDIAACREIGDARIRGLYGGPNADHASRDDESAGKAQSIAALGSIEQGRALRSCHSLEVSLLANPAAFILFLQPGHQRNEHQE